MSLFGFSKTLMNGVKRKTSKYHFAIGILIAILFIICFTFRLIPEPTGDRAIFVSVAEYLLSGNRLYIDIYDNKDPLFFYAVSMQRFVGVTGEYLFELGMVIIATVSAYDISRSIDHTGTKHKMLLLIAVPLLVTGRFWMPGFTHLPATALSLLACSLFFRKKMVFAGGCIGLVAFMKLIMFPLPAIFCLTHEVLWWDKKNSREHFSRMVIGFTSVSIMMIIILLTRHELLGYLQTQQNNFLYSNSVLVDNSNLGNAFASHLRSMFLLNNGSLRLGLSIIAIISFSVYIITQPTIEKKSKSFLISTLATYIISIIVLGLTGIWFHHLQLIYFSQTLILIYIVISLKSKKAFANSSFGIAIFGIAIIFLALLLSGTIRFTPYVDSPGEIMTKISSLSLTQESPEIRAFRAIHPNGAAFARLGQNSNVIPHGAANDKLLCPDFAQYYFYSPERLDNILTCIKTSPTLIVDKSFSRYDQVPSWWPRESQKQIMIESWNDFVTAGENLITTQYSCKKIGTVRICDSVAK